MTSESEPAKVIFFDLDDTLCDHRFSLYYALSAVKRKYSSLSGFEPKYLKNQYNFALNQAYDQYLNKTLTHEESNIEKVRIFFASLNLPEPSVEEIKEFRTTYKTAYRQVQRATKGSLETLTRLREHGYKIGIITNGGTETQTKKLKAIGLDHLVDRLISSEEVGHKKPDQKIFQFAIDLFNAPLHTTVMVGDDAKRDILGAQAAQLVPIWYSPSWQEILRPIPGVPIISKMTDLLGHLGIHDEGCQKEQKSSPRNSSKE